MIIYEQTLDKFIEQCNKNLISNEIAKEMHLLGVPFSHNEENSWANSLPFVAEALNDDDIDKSINVAVEYKSRLNKSRVDFIVYGKDEYNKDSIVIIELKQWSRVSSSNKPNYVFAYGGGGRETDYQHPSYQSLRYGHILKGFNEYVQDNNVSVNTCSYCHNMDNIYAPYIDDKNKYDFLTESPIYLKEDKEKLTNFVKKYVKYGSRRLLYDIDNAKIRPSKDFSKMLYEALKGKSIFTLDDGQSNAVATIVDETNKALEHNKRTTIIIKGGPGSGKSVVAINVLGQLIHPKDDSNPKNACYCTVNFTPRKLYEELLVSDKYKRSAISNLFKTFAAFSKASECDFDCVLFDEAHRNYVWKFGNGVKREVDMIDRAFYASRVNVWFIDEDQQVTKDDFLTIDRIKQYAKKYNSYVIETPELALTSQFRCLGGETYIDFINTLLGYNEGIVTKYNPCNYDFKVFDSPSLMYKEIQKHQSEYPNSRLLSGYTHDWVSRENESLYDFILEDGKFMMKWNKRENYSYINDNTQTDRIGCIHTIQGVDMAYAGVIIGKDMKYREGHIVFDQTENASTDVASGIRKASADLAVKLIRNTYKVLLTRGINGTYIYCEDDELGKYFKQLLSK